MQNSESNFNISYLNNIKKRNIDIEIIAELEISELFKLYSLSGKSKPIGH
ncbi:MAG: hypothetical protein WC197_03640 [Candidatus Gastranaerophilaceae bacterium]